jgi:hypothetical protein
MSELRDSRTGRDARLVRIHGLQRTSNEWKNSGKPIARVFSPGTPIDINQSFV